MQALPCGSFSGTVTIKKWPPLLSMLCTCKKTNSAVTSDNHALIFEVRAVQVLALQTGLSLSVLNWPIDLHHLQYSQFRGTKVSLAPLLAVLTTLM